jgi:hypothetical protein
MKIVSVLQTIALVLGFSLAFAADAASENAALSKTGYALNSVTLPLDDVSQRVALPRTFFAIAPLRAVMIKLAQLKDKIIAELQTMDTMADTPVPGSAATPPDIWDPYAHQCLPALISFLQSTPTPASVPSPSGGAATGPLVAIELSRLKLIGIEDFVAEINQRGFPAQLKIACAAYVADIKDLPFRLSTDTNANLLGLLNAIIQIGG